MGPAERDVVLRDGTTMRLRPPARDDEARVIAFLENLSDESRYLRFHGFAKPTPRLVEPMLEPDWLERGALAGTIADEGGERIVALGSYVRLRDPVRAEVAFAVADELQGKGVGTRLLEQLAQEAARVGVGCFLAEVLPDNRSMLRVFESAGFGVHAVFVLFVPPVVTGGEEVAAAIRRAADGSKPVLPVVMGVAGTTYGCRRSTCARCSTSTACRSSTSGTSRASRTVLPLPPSSATRSWPRRRRPASTRPSAGASRATCATPTTCARRSRRSGCPPCSSRWSGARRSCWPASSRTRCSARWSPSGRAACWPRSSAMPRFASHRSPTPDAEELVLGGKAGRLVRGFRTRPSDASALIDVIHRLSRLAEDLPEVAELDLNPVLARPEGCVVVDARVRVSRPRSPARTKTW